MLLLCLDRASTNRVMREVHAGLRTTYGRTYVGPKIMRTDYFWLTMEMDCCQFVQRCPKCQIHGDFIHGRFRLKSSSGHEFILVAIDYSPIPHELILDRGVHFRAEVDTLVQRYGIRHHRSSAYRSQTNGAVEAANKNIKRIYGGWLRLLEIGREASFRIVGLSDFFSHLYMSHTLLLVYGIEAVLPVEIEMGS
ncbi:hypothetical protein CK203_031232 [Vitis vinifera]|uniref:Integrase catalytic domain-containing protein n=1 Tax=Vitis vinifera TaxID=29760 RepID=A0A438IXJ0_VITVI|nr:hypothetical protein CK203_031232 [Vitis vinifera]